MPRCGPQSGGFTGGTAITVTGKNFVQDFGYTARFALKQNETSSDFGVQSNRVADSLFSVKYVVGLWMSSTELRFAAPVFTDVTHSEVSRTAVVGIFINGLGPATVSNSLSSTVLGMMPRCYSIVEGKHARGPTYSSPHVNDGFYGREETWLHGDPFPRERMLEQQTTLWDYTLTQRAVLFSSNYKRHNVVRIDPSSSRVTDLCDSGSGGLKKPAGLDIGPDNALYVASRGSRQILRYDTTTGHFLGVWVDVKGEPRGIRWHRDYLYVIDGENARVLIYHWRLHTVNSRQGDFQGDSPTVVGRFAGKIDISMVTEPWDLRFHIWKSDVRLYISSMLGKSVHQFMPPLFSEFNATQRRGGSLPKYEGTFTQVPVNMASGFDFSYQTQNADLFVTGQYAANTWMRFNGTSGGHTGMVLKDVLKQPTSLLIHGDSLYVGSTGRKGELREYDLTTGRLVQGTELPGVESNYVTTTFKC